jgi:hypothetical protein
MQWQIGMVNIAMGRERRPARLTQCLNLDCFGLACTTDLPITAVAPPNPIFAPCKASGRDCPGRDVTIGRSSLETYLICVASQE